MQGRGDGGQGVHPTVYPTSQPPLKKNKEMTITNQEPIFDRFVLSFSEVWTKDSSNFDLSIELYIKTCTAEIAPEV